MGLEREYRKPEVEWRHEDHTSKTCDRAAILRGLRAELLQGEEREGQRGKNKPDVEV